MIVPFAPKEKFRWSPVKLFQKEQHMSYISPQHEHEHICAILLIMSNVVKNDNLSVAWQPE